MAEEGRQVGDVRELIHWLVDLADNRIRRDMRLVLCRIEDEWALAETGPANRFTGVTAMGIPDDVGQKLSGYWSQNGYGRYTGGKTPDEVLAVLELIYPEAEVLRAARVAELASAAAALTREQRNQKRAMIRQMAVNLLLTVASLSDELGLDDYNLVSVQTLARVADE